MDFNQDRSSPEIKYLRTQLHHFIQLLESLANTAPLQALANKLANLLNGAAIFYRADGNVIAKSGKAPQTLIWQALQDSEEPARTTNADIGLWHVTIRKVSLHKGIYAIALATQLTQPDKSTTDYLLDTTEKLLSAVHGASFEALLQQKRDREHILMQLFHGISNTSATSTWAAMERFGFRAHEPLRMIAACNSNRTHITDIQLTQVSESAELAAVPILIRTQINATDTPDLFTCVVPDNHNSRKWIQQLTETFLIGVSESTDRIIHATKYFHQAQNALNIAKRLATQINDPKLIKAVFLDDINIATWLITQSSPNDFNTQTAKLLEQIKDPVLLETITVYLANNLNIKETAKILYTHSNTVRYRLHNIEQLLGRKLTDPFCIADLTLALYAEIHLFKAKAAKAKYNHEL